MKEELLEKEKKKLLKIEPRRLREELLEKEKKTLLKIEPQRLREELLERMVLEILTRVLI